MGNCCRKDRADPDICFLCKERHWKRRFPGMKRYTHFAEFDKIGHWRVETYKNDVQTSRVPVELSDRCDVCHKKCHKGMVICPIYDGITYAGASFPRLDACMQCRCDYCKSADELHYKIVRRQKLTISLRRIEFSEDCFHPCACFLCTKGRTYQAPSVSGYARTITLTYKETDQRPIEIIGLREGDTIPNATVRVMALKDRRRMY